MPEIRTQTNTVLYSTARSGSTLIEVAMRQYLSVHHHLEPLSEFFNVCLPYQLDPRGLKLAVGDWLPPSHKAQFSQEDLLRMKRERLSDLCVASGAYFLKVFRLQLPDAELLKLLAQSQVFLVYRENLWEHLLSYMISAQTELYYETTGVQWQEKQLSADYKFFLRFLASYRNYQKIKATFPIVAEICYERFLNESRADYMRSLGFNLPFDWENLSYPKKQNEKNKELAFSNLEELRRWFESSFSSSARNRRGF